MSEHSLEIELKYRFGDRHAFERVLTWFTREHQPGPVLQTNHFFDTPKHHLRQMGLGLRLRQEGDDYFLTAKGPAPQSVDSPRNTAAMILAEEEIRLTPSQANAILKTETSPLAVFNSQMQRLKNISLIRQMDEIHQKCPLIYIGHFKNYRKRIVREITIGGQDHPFTFEFDRTIFTESVVHYELELELSDTASIESVHAALQTVFQECDAPWTVPKGKASRFFSLLSQNS